VDARTPTLSELPVTTLRGVGAERAGQLARLGIQTVEDLLLHRPRRYDDRRHMARVAELQSGVPAAVRGTIVVQGVKYWRQRQKSVFEFVLDDGTGRLHCRWWNMPYLEDQFCVGQQLIVHGKVIGLKPRTMDHPETEVLEGDEDVSMHFNRIVPVYPLTDGLPQRWLRSLMWRVLEEYGSRVSEPIGQTPIPGFPSRREAIALLHFPIEPDQAETARRRLALDEFVELQAAFRRRRANLTADAKGLPCGGDDNRLIKPFLSNLGFRLTAGQTRVLRELRADMSRGIPMRRLLQGDVGAGKTVVAACCALMAIESGFDVALMAPTEILAGQHFSTFRHWFEPLGVGVGLLTGSRKLEPGAPGGSISGEATQPAHPPQAGLWIGTHALIEEGFAPEKLGLVIIDEQHRFGVAQRERLVRKGRYPHLLVMTATPIPRTLGLTLYGDLDISVIEGAPPGRGRVRSFVRAASELPKVYDFIRQQVTQGRQAYVVYARLDDGEGEPGGPGGLKALNREYAAMQQVFQPNRVGLIHGRLRSEEKEAAMAGFHSGQVKVLLATSVVEVGLDVENATVLVVQNAENFGLAQLHQLRGRIGRGRQEAYCILIATSPNPEARARLEVLVGTQDGFRIAEEDLKLRGPGEFLGRDQSGAPKFRFGDLVKDMDLIRLARELTARPPDSRP